MTDTTVPPAPAAAPSPEIAESSAAERNRFILLLITGIGSLVLIGILCFTTVPDKSAQLLGGLAGMFVSAFLMQNGFYFGSSSSSQKKDDTISKLTQ